MKKNSKHREHKSHYRKSKPAPEVHDVNQFLWAVTNKSSKYKSRMERSVAHLLVEHNIAGTNTEEYWRLKGMAILMGKEFAVIGMPERISAHGSSVGRSEKRNGSRSRKNVRSRVR